jgi:AcrR family transcriptional regulator
MILTVSETEPTSRAAAAARTRKAIADAARQMFAQDGYGDTSVRAIASRAGVDPALVIRHFGSKEKLFLDTVGFRGFFKQAMDGPLDGLGQRLVTSLLSDQHDPTFSAYRAMMHASGSEPVRQRLGEAIHGMFVEPLAPRLSGPDTALRSRLVAAQLGGLIDAIAILGDPVIADADRARLASLFGTAIQSLITYDE